MNPHPRIRRTIKWGGLALCLLLAGVWVRSECVLEVLTGARWQVSWSKGAIDIWKLVFPHQNSAHIVAPVGGVGPRMWWCHTESNGPEWGLAIPLWIPLAPTLLATTAAWRLDALARRRARAGVCPKCHYDRTGVAPYAVCPECGSQPAEPAQHA